MYRDRIESLIHQFPKDYITETGEKFWSGSKRFPQVAKFDANNSDHLGYIL